MGSGDFEYGDYTIDLTTFFASALQRGVDPETLSIAIGSFLVGHDYEGFIKTVNEAGSTVGTSMQTAYQNGIMTSAGDGSFNVFGLFGIDSPSDIPLFTDDPEVSGFVSSMDELWTGGLNLSADSDYARELASEAASVGESIGESLVDGEEVGAERAAASSTIGSTIAGYTEDSLKSSEGFDINSPSKRMIPIGESVFEGILVGIYKASGQHTSVFKDSVENTQHSVAKAFKNLGTYSANKYIDGLSDISKKTTKNISTAIKESANNTMSNAFIFRDLGSSIVSNISNGITIGRAYAANAINALATALKLPFTNKYLEYYNVGSDIAKGLAKGIVDNRSTPINAAIEVALDTLNESKKTLGINSPSKEFEKVGMYSMYGWRDAVLQYGSLVEAANESVAADALDSFSSIISNVSDNLSLDSDITPVIRPVIDMTDVDSGFKYINGLSPDSSIKLSSRLEAVSASQMSNVPTSNTYNVTVEFTGPVNSDLDIESAIMSTFSKMQTYARM